MKNIDLKNLLILGAVIILFVTIGFSSIPFIGIFMGVGVVVAIPWLRKDKKTDKRMGHERQGTSGGVAASSSHSVEREVP